MTAMTALALLAFYAVASLAWFVFGLNCYVLLALYLRRRKAAVRFHLRVLGASAGWRDPERRPVVTTQIARSTTRPMWRSRPRKTAARLCRSVNPFAAPTAHV